ncbi:LuxR C-terminal-related transcriptional regulator [Streptomyces sp. NPDC046985]|uniref:helix-turn-helix transcriptional regulator n=1 Tax=Streptomyces sp. NPDC046985 TaxID=3155377 RepID=UPI0033D35F56
MSGPHHDRPSAHREAVATLASGVARACSYAGGLVLLRGATGTGRTSVLESAIEDASAHGMRVLRARCAPGDGDLPFGTVLQLLGVAPGFEQARTEREQGELLGRELLRQAEGTPLLMAVDDVHLADAPSHRWLVESARHTDRLCLPVLLAVTERGQYDVDPPAPGFAHTLSPARVRIHTLLPLAPADAAALVRERFPEAPAAWVDDCARAGAGSPLLLRALLDDLRGPGPHGALPHTVAALYAGAYAAAVAWWLDSAGAGTAEVARVLAALDADRHGAGPAGPPGGPLVDLAGLLAELTGTDRARVAGWLTAMTGLGLLRVDRDGRHRYAHPLLRDAVLAGVPESRRRAAHRGAAELLLHRGASTEVMAGELLNSGPVGAVWASSVLHDAAALAVREGRVAEAVPLLRRALDEPLPDHRRQRLLTELGSLEAADRGAAAAVPLLTEALRLAAAPRERVRAAVALGTALAALGKTGTAVEVLTNVDDQLAHDRPDLSGVLRSASVLLAERDQTVRRDAHRRLSETAERSSEPIGPAAHAVLIRYAATAGLTSAREAMRRMRLLLAEPSDPLTEPFLLGAAAAVAQWADELDEAERLVDRGLAGQRSDLLHPMHDALVDTRADIAAARGVHVRPPAEPPLRPDAGPGNVQAHALLGLVAQDRIAEARRLADAFDLRAAADSWELNRFLYARGVLRAADGDTVGALHDFLECGRRQLAREVRSPVVTPWRSAAAECWLTLGAPREAITLAEEELRLARVWDTPRTVGRALRALGAVTGGRRGLELAERAVRMLRDAPEGAGPELAHALLAQGRALIAAGERAQARSRLREAAELAERLGASRLRVLAETALRAGGARRATAARTGSGSLTGSERRIAQLAADGRTNTEIAALLHLARRTVETHLTSTYKKLGIRRRGELRRALTPDDGVPAALPEPPPSLLAGCDQAPG